jgi:hypothetical protein
MPRIASSSAPIELDDYRWLVSADAAGWLATTSQTTGESLLQTATRLRQSLTPQRAQLVLEQARLRHRGLAKFAAAERMFFTPLGLEQATDEVVARHKAQRFPRGKLVADLCCGIGGDLLGLAQRGPVRGVDCDPVAALFAQANLASAPGSPADPPVQARIEVAEATVEHVRDAAAWHIDPDRRPRGRRTTRVELHEPGPDLIDQLRSVCPDAAVKLAPAATLPDSWTAEAELEWISQGGECRQLVAWFGRLANAAGSRTATVLRKDQEPRSLRGERDRPIPVAAALGRFVFEPDPAVLASGLVGALADEHGLATLAARSIYLTGDQRISDAALATFEIIDSLPADLRRLRTWLRSHGIGRVEVKKRGTEHDPATVERALRGGGEGRAVVILTRVGSHVRAIVARRIESA